MSFLVMAEGCKGAWNYIQNIFAGEIVNDNN